MTIILMFFVLPYLANAQAYWERFNTDETDNNIACFWYIPTAMPSNRLNLIGYDWVIINPENQFNNPEIFSFLRYHGVKKILVYNGYVEQPIHFDQIKPWGSHLLTELKNQYANWFLTQPGGQAVTFWPGMRLMNLSLICPRVNNQLYVDWMARNIVDGLLRVGTTTDSLRYDGMLVDNLWTDISWWVDKNGGQIVDFDNDGQQDSPEKMNHYFHEGQDYFLGLIRANTPKHFLIIGNYGSTDYLDQVDGKQFENFPDVYLGKESNVGSWIMSMLNAKLSPGPDIFNAREGEEWFTLLSSKLLDQIYFAYMQNTPFREEYKSLNLGRPIAVMGANDNDIYFRAFENGTVYVDPNKKTGWIEYQNGFRRDDFLDNNGN